MTRKAFIADITAAANNNIPGIISVTRGDDDGEVNFCFVPTSGEPIEFALLLSTDIHEYPASTQYFLFTQSENVPPGVNDAVEKISTTASNKSIVAVIEMLSKRLSTLLASGSREDPLDVGDDTGSDGGNDNEEGDDPDFGGGYDDDEDFESFGAAGGTSGFSSNATYKLDVKVAKVLNQRIRHDLRIAKLAGFKIGILDGMKAQSLTGMISMSVHVSKLGLSEEAMQAWDLEAEYIVLLVKYSAGYKTFESIISEPAAKSVEFRIGVSDKYKPTPEAARAAFTDITHNKSFDSETNEEGNDEPAVTGAFNGLFISSSLNDLMNTQFISLVKIRRGLSINWSGAKRYYNDKQGRFNEAIDGLDTRYLDEPQPTQDNLPDMISADHLDEATRNKETVSFPLIAFQFALRHLVRCTEYCLVCHDKIEGDFEALKPYVCSKPLCLYQYMSLGFGPSIEHEILTQPYVVDLLVSFCYSSVRYRRLREFPIGMSLSVPPMAACPPSSATRATLARTLPLTLNPAPSNGTAALRSTPSEIIKVSFDLANREIIFEQSKKCPVYVGQWVVITIGDASEHCRVNDVSNFPFVKVDAAVTRCYTLPVQYGAPAVSTPTTTPPPVSLVSAGLMVYSNNFDELSDDDKSEMILMLLETIPSIKEMRAYLIRHSRTSAPKLESWKDRISKASLGLLRWIIASNRSCIVQIDKCPGQDDDELRKAKIRLDQKILNIPENWIQFRFAQGSPDKEQRFLNALKNEQANLPAKYPTLMAFHGSPIANWHSIIRQGLDFKETLHGRAYGHGVYHALDQSISISYAQADTGYWPLSELKISSVMSLNEIVNNPDAYSSKTPYLVVQHVDWIQCRYLLCQTNSKDPYNAAKSDTNNSTDTLHVNQDPKYPCISTIRKPIRVPHSALSISRAFRSSNSPDERKTKKPKTLDAEKSNSASSTLIITDDEDIEDIAFLCSDVEAEDKAETKSKGKGKEKADSDDELVLLSSGSRQPSKPLTDFVPGTLDQSSLPILNQPTYATPSATMALNRELQKMLKIQEKTPIHELGWYINPEVIENVYQWIVELHSFSHDLPIAKDMKKAGITSVVLEMRFGKDYPFSPPFVRVIRPRFLPFMSGGGGHVTLGGAMCMELLTNSGWTAVTTLEAVLLQVKLAIESQEPKPARLEFQGKQKGGQRDYGTAEAIDAYIRACRTHGWEVPKDFNDFSAYNM